LNGARDMRMERNLSAETIQALNKIVRTCRYLRHAMPATFFDTERGVVCSGGAIMIDLHRRPRRTDGGNRVDRALVQCLVVEQTGP